VHQLEIKVLDIVDARYNHEICLANNLDPLQEPIGISHHVAPLKQKGPVTTLEYQGR